MGCGGLLCLTPLVCLFIAQSQSSQLAFENLQWHDLNWSDFKATSNSPRRNINLNCCLHTRSVVCIVVFWRGCRRALSETSAKIIHAVWREVVTLSSSHPPVLPVGDRSEQAAGGTMRMLISHSFPWCLLSYRFPFCEHRTCFSFSLLKSFPLCRCSHPHPSLSLSCRSFVKGLGSQKLLGWREQFGEDQWLWDVPPAGWRCLFHRRGPQTDPC